MEVGGSPEETFADLSPERAEPVSETPADAPEAPSEDRPQAMIDVGSVGIHPELTEVDPYPGPDSKFNTAAARSDPWPDPEYPHVTHMEKSLDGTSNESLIYRSSRKDKNKHKGENAARGEVMPDPKCVNAGLYPCVAPPMLEVETKPAPDPYVLLSAGAPAIEQASLADAAAPAEDDTWAEFTPSKKSKEKSKKSTVAVGFDISDEYAPPEAAFNTTFTVGVCESHPEEERDEGGILHACDAASPSSDSPAVFIGEAPASDIQFTAAPAPPLQPDGAADSQCAKTGHLYNEDGWQHCTDCWWCTSCDPRLA